MSSHTYARSTVDRVDIRPLMASFPTGVAVITTWAPDGRPWGMTCTSLCSVALSPPTLLVCLRSASPTLAALAELGSFAVNLLHEGGREAADLFASGAADRYARLDWYHDDECRGPHLIRAANEIADCQLVRTEPVGDHTVVFGEVVRVTQRAASPPLLYGRRQYASWPITP